LPQANRPETKQRRRKYDACVYTVAMMTNLFVSLRARALARKLRALPFAAALLLLSHAGFAADLRIGMAADVTSIDPHQVNIAPNNAVAWHVFDALTLVDADTRLVPGLATSWRAVDSTTWEFKLRRGVKFHDGSDFSAEDVVFSMDRAAELGAKGGQFAQFVKPIVSKQIIDPYTIRFKTATPYAMVPYDLNSIYIVSRKAAAGAGTEDFNSGKAAVGTGPFKLAAFKRGDRVELVRNESYWGAADNKTAAWDKVSLRILPNDPARTAALLSGDVDAIENIPTADAARFKSNSNFRLEQKVSWRTIFFHLDQYRDAPPGVTDKNGKPLGKNPFKDARVREAIAMAINRQAIVARAMEGFALPASNIVAPPVFGHDASLKPAAYDPEGAKKLLAAAGYPDGFSIVLAAPNNRYVNDDQVAQVVAQMLARAGIAVARVETHPAATYFTKARNGDFGFAMLGWGSFSGDLALRTLVASVNPEKGYGTWNWGHYSNAKVDQLVSQALGAVDPAKREVVARDAMGIAMRDYAVIPVHHQIASWAMKKSLAYTPRTDEFTFAHQFRQQ
jgi:peptide/nickel transport system substrate-binding protein